MYMSFTMIQKIKTLLLGLIDDIIESFEFVFFDHLMKYLLGITHVLSYVL